MAYKHRAENNLAHFHDRLRANNSVLRARPCKSPKLKSYRSMQVDTVIAVEIAILKSCRAREDRQWPTFV
jgi:hypothetical protein